MDTSIGFKFGYFGYRCKAYLVDFRPDFRAGLLLDTLDAGQFFHFLIHSQGNIRMFQYKSVEVGKRKLYSYLLNSETHY